MPCRNKQLIIYSKLSTFKTVTNIEKYMTHAGCNSGDGGGGGVVVVVVLVVVAAAAAAVETCVVSHISITIYQYSQCKPRLCF